MANIRKIEGKNGVSYKITVSMGRTREGKQLRHYKTFAPQFEEELRLGFQPDNRITFEEYADYFMQTRRKAGHPAVNSFQPQEIAAILEALEQEPVKWCTSVHLMIVTGCRRGEIMGLKWENIDLKHGVLRICETLLASDTGVYIDSPKTPDSRRYVNIPRETMALLQDYRQDQQRIRAAVGDRWEENGYVFTQENGRPMHPDSINGWLNGFSARHGLPHINPHAFRHSMASILIGCGTDILSVSKRLGHSTTSTTLNFYGHLLQKADAESSECIAGLLAAVRQMCAFATAALHFKPLQK